MECDVLDWIQLTLHWIRRGTLVITVMNIRFS